MTNKINIHLSNYKASTIFIPHMHISNFFITLEITKGQAISNEGATFITQATRKRDPDVSDQIGRKKEKLKKKGRANWQEPTILSSSFALFFSFSFSLFLHLNLNTCSNSRYVTS